MTYKLFSMAYSTKGDFDKAIDYAQKSLEVALKQPDLFDKIQAYDALTQVYIAKNDYDNALLYCQTGLDSSKSLVGYNDSRIHDLLKEAELEDWKRVAAGIARVIARIDPQAMVADRFWSTFVDDLTNGDFPTESFQRP